MNVCRCCSGLLCLPCVLKGECIGGCDEREKMMMLVVVTSQGEESGGEIDCVCACVGGRGNQENIMEGIDREKENIEKKKSGRRMVAAWVVRGGKESTGLYRELGI